MGGEGGRRRICRRIGERETDRQGERDDTNKISVDYKLGQEDDIFDVDSSYRSNCEHCDPWGVTFLGPS